MFLRSIAAASIALVATAHSKEERDVPWNVRDAAEKLVDKHALRMPVGDWFLTRKGGNLVEYFKPRLSFQRVAGGWEAELLTAKYRERVGGKWDKWKSPDAQYGSWTMAKISITTPATGGAFAKFTNAGVSLEGYTAPRQSYVTLLQ